MDENDLWAVISEGDEMPPFEALQQLHAQVKTFKGKTVDAVLDRLDHRCAQCRSTDDGNQTFFTTEGAVADGEFCNIPICACALLLDVRSPAEYKQGHIPGAISLPLFNDAERARVGIAYKKQGREAAMELGMRIVKPKMPTLLQHVKSMLDARPCRAPDGAAPDVIVQCWRGGMRSGSVAWMLRQNDVQATTLTGGYKAFRQWALGYWGDVAMPAKRDGQAPKAKPSGRHNGNGAPRVESGDVGVSGGTAGGRVPPAHHQGGSAAGQYTLRELLSGRFGSVAAPALLGAAAIAACASALVCARRETLSRPVAALAANLAAKGVGLAGAAAAVAAIVRPRLAMRFASRLLGHPHYASRTQRREAAFGTGENPGGLPRELVEAARSLPGPRLCVIGGRTGVGKTRVLHTLRDHFQQYVIDLEGLANHRGSTFGWVGSRGGQPTPEQFTNRLAMAWRQVELRASARGGDRGWLFIEDEDTHIGCATLPPAVWAGLRCAPLVIRVVLSEAARVKLLVEDYAGIEAEGDASEWFDRMEASISRLHKRLGGDCVKFLVTALRARDFSAVVKELLKYYDKLYDNHVANCVGTGSGAGSRVGKVVDVELCGDSFDGDKLARLILEQLEAHCANCRVE